MTLQHGLCFITWQSHDIRMRALKRVDDEVGPLLNPIGARFVQWVHNLKVAADGLVAQLLERDFAANPDRFLHLPRTAKQRYSRIHNMGTAGQSLQHALRIVQVHRLVQHASVEMHRRVGT